MELPGGRKIGKPQRLFMDVIKKRTHRGMMGEERMLWIGYGQDLLWQPLKGADERRRRGRMLS